MAMLNCSSLGVTAALIASVRALQARLLPRRTTHSGQLPLAHQCSGHLLRLRKGTLLLRHTLARRHMNVEEKLNYFRIS
jgi:hypothetical protein